MLLILCAVIAYFMGKVFQNVFAPYLKEIRHFDGEPLDYESPGVDLEHSYAEAKREVAEMAAERVEDEKFVEDEEPAEDEEILGDDRASDTDEMVEGVEETEDK